MMIVGIYAKKSANTKRIIAKYNQCVRLARYASTYRDRWMLSAALVRIVNSISRYIATLEYEGNIHVEAYSRSALQICKLAAWIANEAGDLDRVVMAILAALMTARTEDSDAYRWAVNTAQNIPDQELRQDALDRVQRAVSRWKGEHVEGDYEGNTLLQAAQNMAAALGIDPSDENNPVVRALIVAVRDNTPERVLTNCEHLLVTQGEMGPNAQLIHRTFNIGTAGSKVVHCTLHDFHHEDKELDSAYETFKRRYCDSCGDCSPRPVGWV